LDLGPDGTVWFIDCNDNLYRWNKTGYHHMGVKATDVGVGANGTVWIVGTRQLNSGFNVAYLRGDGEWVDVDTGGAVRIDVSKGGIPWMVQTNNSIWQHNEGRWILVPGKATDIGFGADNSVVMIGMDSSAWKWSPGQGKWVRMGGTGFTNVTVDRDGNPWVVKKDHSILAWDNAYEAPSASTSSTPPPVPKDDIWGIGRNNAAWRWNGSGWTDTGGCWKELGGGQYGKPWAIGCNNKINQWDGSRWVEKTGDALDIGVSANGYVWIVGTNKAPYQWNGSGWSRKPGCVERIDVDALGYPWAVSCDAKVQRWNGGGWDEVSGGARATDVGIGATGPAWILGTNKLGAGYGVYHRDGRGWRPVNTGGAVRIDVDASGAPWITQNNLTIWKWNGTTWREMPGKSKGVGIGTKGLGWARPCAF